MGRHPSPDRRRAYDAMDCIYEDPSRRATVFDLAIALSNGIRGDVMVFVFDNGEIACAIDGPADRYIRNTTKGR